MKFREKQKKGDPKPKLGDKVSFMIVRLKNKVIKFKNNKK